MFDLEPTEEQQLMVQTARELAKNEHRPPFAALFGGGRLMDAFTIAFRIPNLLRDLFAEGALLFGAAW